MAIKQIRYNIQGRTCQRKRAAHEGHKEALRFLKRRLTDGADAPWSGTVSSL